MSLVFWLVAPSSPSHVLMLHLCTEDLGDGYGFPSSHSQWMGYFASFLFLHFSLRHRWVSTGSTVLDYARDVLLFAFILSWSAAVAFSRYVPLRSHAALRSPFMPTGIPSSLRRYYLSYHTIPQVLWGFGIGVMFGSTYYTLVELIPTRRPNSLLGRLRTALLTNSVSTWFRLRDGWAVWPDAGTDAQYATWRAEWDRQRLASAAKAKKE